MKKSKIVGNFSKTIWIPLIYMALILIVFNIVKPGFIGTINILFAVPCILYTRKFIKQKELTLIKYFLKLVSTYLQIFLLVGFIRLFGKYGVLGFVIIILGLVIYKIWKQWDFFINGIREIETMIFGKPLDKKNWNKGELKNGRKRTNK